MTFLSDLRASHGEDLDAAEHAAIDAALRRDEMTGDFVAPSDRDALTAQSAFIAFDREFSGEPVSLFGQDIGALAYTRMRIFRSRRNADGTFAPDEEIFAALVSERALTEATLLGSSEGSPVTVRRLGDTDLPPVAPGPTLADRARDELHATLETGEAGAALDALKAALDGANRPGPDLRNAVSKLENRIDNAGDMTFAFDRYLATMARTRTHILTEAAHAALHADRVAEAIAASTHARIADTAAGRGPGNDIDTDTFVADEPMAAFMADPMPPELQSAIRKLVVAAMKDIAAGIPKCAAWIQTDEDGLDIVRFPEDRNIRIALAGNRGDRDLVGEVKAMASMMNAAFNPSIAASRAKTDPRHAAFSVSRRGGGTDAIHTRLPTDDRDFFALTIAPAIETTRHGETTVRKLHQPLVEIEMTADDLMTALRGAPNGDPAPCTLATLCGRHIRRVDRPAHAIEASVAALQDAADRSPARAELTDAMDALKALVATKRSGKAWARETADAVARVEAALEAFGAWHGTALGDGFAEIDRHVVASTRETLDAIAADLPEAAASALIRRDDTEDG